MAELYFYNEDAPSLTVTLDSGEMCQGVRTMHKDRMCFLVVVPHSASGGITVDLPGYTWNSSQRGLIMSPTTTNPECTFLLDDIRGRVVVEPPPAGPSPKPPNPSDPLAVLNWVYETGNYDLSTTEGCGLFTEAACTALHDYNSPMWGHDRRTPPQNSYNGHAVDAIQCIGGEYYGMWDIIKGSVGPDAEPCFNLAGAPNPPNWVYPAGA